ncbi:MAG: hypothetical protein K9H49_15715 [Bacteroidales bacterium]|nr:hypothetical protein [Bacteroidales bacterium]MCF8391056.1 hypothetical protein [Bacteroidales bacterium]
MKKNLLFIILSFISIPLFSQKALKSTFTIISYNVENLFDTIDNPDFIDEEFTPGSDKKWNSEKYYKKLDDLGAVLSSQNKKELPEIIGLMEVENRAVLEDLVATKSLKDGNYAIIHEEGKDARGIDVALLYRKDELSSVKFESIPILFPFDSSTTTRDILHVWGKTEDGQNMHFFVNHWSSRIGGNKETEPKRMYAAVSLRRQLDLLYSKENDPRIVIMGDFNDEPTNRSLMSILMAGNKYKNIETGDLYNLFYDKHNVLNEGSYNYRNNWNMLDQIIVSYNLINQKDRYSCNYDSGKIIKEDFMIFINEQGQEVPNRTYGGPNYYGGISDHFPVTVVFEK